MSEASFQWVGTIFLYVVVYFLLGYTVENKKPDKINQAPFVSMKAGIQWIFNQVILIRGLTEWTIFLLIE